MTSRLRYRAALFTLCITLLVVALVAVADGRRDFSALFDVTDVTPQGDDVVATLHVELSNHSDESIYEVVLTIEDYGSDPPATLSYLAVGAGESARESAVLTMPVEICDGWMQGNRPMFRIDFVNAVGQPGTAILEVAYVPLAEESGS